MEILVSDLGYGDSVASPGAFEDGVESGPFLFQGSGRWDVKLDA